MKNLTIKQKIVGVLIALITFVGGGEIYGNASGNRPENSYGYSAIATSGPMAISAGNSVSILATSTRRAYAIFQVQSSCLVPVYLRLANSSGTQVGQPATSGIIITATSGPYEIKQENRYVGAVYASSSAACNLNITEAQF